MQRIIRMIFPPERYQNSFTSYALIHHHIKAQFHFEISFFSITVNSITRLPCSYSHFIIFIANIMITIRHVPLFKITIIIIVKILADNVTILTKIIVLQNHLHMMPMTSSVSLAGPLLFSTSSFMSITIVTCIGML